jgi:signal transduction histidine kinase
VNQPDITRFPFNVNELVAESLEIVLSEGLFLYQLITDDAAALLNFKLSSLQKMMALLSLIHNGVKAMGKAQVSDGKILHSSSLAANNREMSINVRDAGPGMCTAMQQEIFQPSITTKSNGIGLSISRALVETHGGKLRHNQDAGLGTMYSFKLPV